METYLTTASGIQLDIVNTLLKHRYRLPATHLAKLVGRPRVMVDEALKKLETEGVVKVDGDQVTLSEQE